MMCLFYLSVRPSTKLARISLKRKTSTNAKPLQANERNIPSFDVKPLVKPVLGINPRLDSLQPSQAIAIDDLQVLISMGKVDITRYTMSVSQQQQISN